MRASTELDNLLDAGTNFRTEPDGRDGRIHKKWLVIFATLTPFSKWEKIIPVLSTFSHLKKECC